MIFILATTEANKIPVTILSRCQRYDFKRISIDTIAARLRELIDKEQWDVEEKAVRYIAKTADGSMRDGLSLLDQCAAFYIGERLTYDHVLEILGAVDTDVFSRLLREILSMDVSKVIETVDELVMGGRELSQLAADFTWYLRNLLLVKCSDDMEDVLDVSTENLAQLKEEAGMIENETLIRYIRIFSDLTSRASVFYAEEGAPGGNADQAVPAGHGAEFRCAAGSDPADRKAAGGRCGSQGGRRGIRDWKPSGRRKGGARESETGASQGPERGCKSSGEGFSEYCRGCISHAPDISEESALSAGEAIA